MKRMLPVLALLAAAAPALADDDKLSLTTGFDYSTGKYGNATATNTLYVPVIAAYETGDLTLKLTVPYISVTGPGGVIQGFGRIQNATTTGFGKGGGNATSTNSGLGDVTAQAGYTVYSEGGFSLDAVGKIKFGTADVSKGLGTGQNDYSGQLDGYYAVVEGSTLMATAGYKKIGAPVGVPTHSVPYGMLGFDQKATETSHIGVMYNQENSVSAGIPAQQDVTVYASQKFSDVFKVQAYLLKGFTTSSPDFGGGLMLTGYF